MIVDRVNRAANARLGSRALITALPTGSRRGLANRNFSLSINRQNGALPVNTRSGAPVPCELLSTRLIVERWKKKMLSLSTLSEVTIVPPAPSAPPSRLYDCRVDLVPCICVGELLPRRTKKKSKKSTNAEKKKKKLHDRCYLAKRKIMPALGNNGV